MVRNRSSKISLHFIDFVIPLSDAAGVNDNEINSKRPKLRQADLENFADDSD